jgi:site-specific DNA-methyltransferase (adenine-specific)
MKAPHYEAPGVTLFHGDCLDVLRDLPDESVHAVVTDPPYGLSNTDPGHVTEAITHWTTGDRAFLPSAGGGFMGKAWDEFVPPPAVWDECMRVLKPGGHLLAFAGSRTLDLMALSIRLAGFDIRDSIAWLYGSGFPKSMDVAKAIDATVLHGGSNSKRLREAEQAGDGETYTMTGKNNGIMGESVTVERKTWTPETDQAKTWNGWGTALKPAFEPIVVARKPLIGTVAANVLAHGTGALNIDATRTATDEVMGHGGRQFTPLGYGGGTGADGSYRSEQHPGGRWPLNVVTDSEVRTELGDDGKPFPTFRYESKAPTSERPVVNGVTHPTVKPLDLMRWLVRLVTPQGGTVLEPFAGSGTTIEACLREGFDVIAIEREADYLPLIEKRIRKDHAQGFDFDWGYDA